ncbi:cytochrome P450 [Rostrohypoxylon terebratum]|nr:cytochrome P450 [Rostrohypoxylon terebratum]
MALLKEISSNLPSPEGLVELLTVRNALILVCGWVVYQLLWVLWNVSPFHPLYRIPGPKLAAATYLPEYWYDFVRHGRYTVKIGKMHEIYGPLVRINPDEIHCSDFNFVDTIYAAGGRKRDKSAHQCRGSPFEFSIFVTKDHDHHRFRRAPLVKFFSKPQIVQYEPHIRGYAQRLCQKLLAEVGVGKPFTVQDAYSCFGSDVISDYCYGKSFGFLDRDGWLPNYRKPLYSLFNANFVCRFHPIFKHALLAMTWAMDYLPEGMGLMIRTLKVDIPERVRQSKENAEAVVEGKKLPEGVKGNIFNELLDSDLPPAEKTSERLVGEALAMMSGGTETGSWALTVLTFYMLSQPETFAKLTDELRSAVPDPLDLPSWSELERLPYLSAVVQESFRLAHGGSIRSARVPTDEDLVYRGEWKGEKVEHVIPRGWAMSMSGFLIHHDESLFPDSYKFVPERWLDEKGNRRHDLDRCLFSFSKGTRMCIGINLALCEMYTLTAAFALRVFPHMRLYETTEDDVRYDHDTAVPAVKSSSKGVRVTLV